MLRITKYVHSCLLVESDEAVALIDPGQFAYESKLLDIAKLSRLDEIIVTHEHYDHLHLPFIQELQTAFPAVRIVTTPVAAEQLQAIGVQHVQTEATPRVTLFDAAHESVAPLGETPQHIGVHYLDRLTHPGDSHHFTETKEILALPVTAPWGSLAAAAAIGQQLKPKYIIPIHDWHWNQLARAQAYERLEAFFAPQGITFLKPIDGQAIEL